MGYIRMEWVPRRVRNRWKEVPKVDPGEGMYTHAGSAANEGKRMPPGRLGPRPRLGETPDERKARAELYPRSKAQNWLGGGYRRK